MKHKISTVCVICGKTFVKNAPCQITCSPECRHDNDLIKRRAKMQKLREEKEKPIPPKSDLPEVLRLLDIYNSTHRNAPVSYGTFAHMLDSGQTRKEEIERMI